MEVIDLFKKLRDVSGEVIEALENEDQTAIETAMGKFMFLMAQFEAIK